MSADNDFNPFDHVPPDHELPPFVQSLDNVLRLFHQLYERTDGGYRLVEDGKAKAAKLLFDPEKFDFDDPRTWNKMRWVGRWSDPPAKTKP